MSNHQLNQINLEMAVNEMMCISYDILTVGDSSLCAVCSVVLLMRHHIMRLMYTG